MSSLHVPYHLSKLTLKVIIFSIHIDWSRDRAPQIRLRRFGLCALYKLLSSLSLSLSLTRSCQESWQDLAKIRRSCQVLTKILPSIEIGTILAKLHEVLERSWPKSCAGNFFRKGHYWICNCMFFVLLVWYVSMQFWYVSMQFSPFETCFFNFIQVVISNNLLFKDLEYHSPSYQSSSSSDMTGHQSWLYCGAFITCSVSSLIALFCFS